MSGKLRFYTRYVPIENSTKYKIIKTLKYVEQPPNHNLCFPTPNINEIMV